MYYNICTVLYIHKKIYRSIEVILIEYKGLSLLGPKITGLTNLEKVDTSIQ